ncbi:uncharacterized protein DSM5745_10990 [Aspergillus mulundensis]|uniref:Ilp is an apoptosis inhibitor n=1 Tax=Aspergillus mulundensis TaxID=1810919 RepID=A0A3D8QBR0_9EURO|nr:Uncharacterized protein DSM5745_10990 [Aspergillus mulundensis]RDW59295.1 Uncharacterized protein DSM5745_10990 [Aspergillus mulundensis]
MNESHPGRGLGSAIRNLFRSSSPSPPRRRVSRLLRRSRTVVAKHSEEQTARAPGPKSVSPDPDPTAMLGLSETPQSANHDSFDIFEWYPHYQNCQRYFLDHAQHSTPVQAVSAYVNILLPFQRQPYPAHNASSGPLSSTADGITPESSSTSNALPPPVSLLPYIRRLVATGMDYPGMLHGFFGDDWQAGVGPLHEKERCNYLLAARSGGWGVVKSEYDISPLETIPFLRPLQGPLEEEFVAAYKSWSEWLLLRDWEFGPRAPDGLQDSSSQSSRPQSARE